ncbi:MAG: 3-deoxy-manno-octulosonate cytidylyltransferase [Phycisphaerales bacterium]|nr:3-deoxy-manno-octulosonate cytidylyltransferase [Phycisphaerales bacterium]
MRVLGVIPARLASSRFPEKALASATGKAMVVHVLEAALRARSLDAVIVAADHPRIVEAVRAAGGEAMLTREDHPNGTSRLAEVAARTGAEILVNIQGDEPEIEPDAIDAATELLLRTPWADVATLASPFQANENPADPNLVKVVLGTDGRALYFSRARIPHWRDAAKHAHLPPPAPTLRHVGLYAYRAAFLQEFVSWPASPLEEMECLEQLRVLEHGRSIVVAIREITTQGIDTPEQYEAFLCRFNAKRPS